MALSSFDQQFKVLDGFSLIATESFNGRLRNECLNTHWFLSLADARAKFEAWRRDAGRGDYTVGIPKLDERNVPCRRNPKLGKWHKPSRWGGRS